MTRASFLIAATVLMMLGCQDTGPCVTEGAVRKNGLCDCPDGMRSEDSEDGTGARCVSTVSPSGEQNSDASTGPRDAAPAARPDANRPVASQDASEQPGDTTEPSDAGMMASECATGFVSKEGTCVDLDECAAGTADCHPTASCSNQEGAYECICPPGFSGGGKGIACAPKLATGASHVCGVTSDSHVLCWGNNDHGQLGDGTRTMRDAPVMVTGLQNVAAVDTGADFSCALLEDGSVRCWGGNDTLQLGVDVVTDKLTPVVVNGVADVVSLAVSKDITAPMYACAITREGKVYCWGGNADGYLGTGQASASPSFRPVLVKGISDALSIDCAGINCVSRKSGALLCWGKGSVPSFDYGATPVEPFSWQKAVSVKTGPFVACGTNGDGSVFCWGTEILQGATSPSASGPSYAQVDRGIVSLSVGLYHSCAARDTGELLCWGASAGPTRLDNVNNATVVSSFSERACALLKDGSVRCWDMESTPPKSIVVPNVRF